MKKHYVQFDRVTGAVRRYTNIKPDPKIGYVHELSREELEALRGVPPHLFTMGDDGFVRKMTPEEEKDAGYPLPSFWQIYSQEIDVFIGFLSGLCTAISAYAIYRYL